MWRELTSDAPEENIVSAKKIQFSLVVYPTDQAEVEIVSAKIRFSLVYPTDQTTQHAAVEDIVSAKIQLSLVYPTDPATQRKKRVSAKIKLSLVYPTDQATQR